MGQALQSNVCGVLNRRTVSYEAKPAVYGKSRIKEESLCRDQDQSRECARISTTQPIGVI